MTSCKTVSTNLTLGNPADYVVDPFGSGRDGQTEREGEGDSRREWEVERSGSVAQDYGKKNHLRGEHGDTCHLLQRRHTIRTAIRASIMIMPADWARVLP